jgi:peroxiredoxin
VPTPWIISTVALWIVVLFETALLVLLLRALGALRQQITRSTQVVPGGINIGEPMPSLEAIDQDGRKITLEEFQGHHRILAFISPGCQPCSQAIKVLDTMRLEQPGLPIFVVGASNSDENAAYAKEQGVNIPILTPLPGFGGERFRVRGVPIVFIIDEKGVVRAKDTITRREQVYELLNQANTPVATHGR